jgi:hypothetical protein
MQGWLPIASSPLLSNDCLRRLMPAHLFHRLFTQAERVSRTRTQTFLKDGDRKIVESLSSIIG